MIKIYRFPEYTFWVPSVPLPCRVSEKISLLYRPRTCSMSWKGLGLTLASSSSFFSVEVFLYLINTSVFELFILKLVVSFFFLLFWGCLPMYETWALRSFASTSHAPAAMHNWSSRPTPRIAMTLSKQGPLATMMHKRCPTCREYLRITQKLLISLALSIDISPPTWYFDVIYATQYLIFY